ncbi:MAG: hypothetical protein GKR90_00585 [Pseudomonadales bacterium]|nr:hypothetical protein [Pseudomonadales bacterium]
MTEIGHVPSAKELANRSAIEEVIFKHCRGLDRVEKDTLKACYWPDATVDYGFFKGLAHEFCDLISQGIVRHRATHHQVSNTIANIRDVDALVETYLTAYHHKPGGEATEMTYFGRYVDHFQQRDNVWKIQFRHVVMDWNQNLNTTDDMDTGSLSALARSGRMPDDPLYQLQQELFGAPE